MRFIRKNYRLMLTTGGCFFIALIYFGMNYFNRFQQAYTRFGFIFEGSIPLISALVPLYLTVYLVYITPLFFVFNKKKFARVVAAYLFVVFVSGLVYVLFPTKMVWPAFTVKTFSDNFVLLLRGWNVPYNLIPSMHISLAYLATFTVASENRKWGYFLAIVSTLIAFSTLFVKQHYVIDLLAGFLVGLFAYVAFVKK